MHISEEKAIRFRLEMHEKSSRRQIYGVETVLGPDATHCPR